MMRTPSTKTLAQCFDNPREAKAILQSSRAQLMGRLECAEHARQCFNPPKLYELRMLALNACGNFHGVEGAETAAGGEWADYLNAGDTYAPTVIRWRGTYRVQSLGDFIERSRVKFR